MKYKFSTEVIVKLKGFYENAQGVVLSFDRLDQKYGVLLAYNCYKEFNEEDLKPAPKKRGKK
jgi:trehalose-6-phosphate synthase